MKTYQVWSLDVWGNEREGFDVNDRCKVGTVELPEDASDKVIIHTMVEHGYLKPRFQFNVEMQTEGSYWIDHKRTGRPLFELEMAD